MKRIVFPLGFLFLVLGFLFFYPLNAKANGVSDESTCYFSDTALAEPCYTITSVNDFPPPIRMDNHKNIPNIALAWVDVSANAGEALLKNARYIYEFSIDPSSIPACPNGGKEYVGVLGNFGSHGIFMPDYPSGMGIVKLECNL